MPCQYPYALPVSPCQARYVNTDIQRDYLSIVILIRFYGALTAYTNFIRSVYKEEYTVSFDVGLEADSLFRESVFKRLCS